MDKSINKSFEGFNPAEKPSSRVEKQSKLSVFDRSKNILDGFVSKYAPVLEEKKYSGARNKLQMIVTSRMLSNGRITTPLSLLLDPKFRQEFTRLVPEIKLTEAMRNISAEKTKTMAKTAKSPEDKLQEHSLPSIDYQKEIHAIYQRFKISPLAIDLEGARLAQKAKAELLQKQLDDIKQADSLLALVYQDLEKQFAVDEKEITRYRVGEIFKNIESKAASLQIAIADYAKIISACHPINEKTAEALFHDSFQEKTTIDEKLIKLNKYWQAIADNKNAIYHDNFRPANATKKIIGDQADFESASQNLLSGLNPLLQVSSRLQYQLNSSINQLTPDEENRIKSNLYLVEDKIAQLEEIYNDLFDFRNQCNRIITGGRNIGKGRFNEKFIAKTEKGSGFLLEKYLIHNLNNYFVQNGLGENCFVIPATKELDETYKTDAFLVTAVNLGNIERVKKPLISSENYFSELIKNNPNRDQAIIERAEKLFHKNNDIRMKNTYKFSFEDILQNNYYVNENSRKIYFMLPVQIGTGIRDSKKIEYTSRKEAEREEKVEKINKKGGVLLLSDLSTEKQFINSVYTNQDFKNIIREIINQKDNKYSNSDQIHEAVIKRMLYYLEIWQNKNQSSANKNQATG